MAYFRVDTQSFDNSLSKLSRIKKHMDHSLQEISKITSNLSWETILCPDGHTESCDKEGDFWKSNEPHLIN